MGTQPVRGTLPPNPLQPHAAPTAAKKTSVAQTAATEFAAKIKAARQFFQQLPATLAPGLAHVRSTLNRMAGTLSRPPKSEAAKITSLLRSETMQAQTRQLATMAAYFEPTQAIQAFRLATGRAVALADHAQDAGVKDFVDAARQLKTGLAAKLGPDHAGLAVSVMAGQVIADHLKSLPGNAGLAQDCLQTLANYSSALSPTIEQHRGFPELLNAIFAQHSA